MRTVSLHVAAAVAGAVVLVACGQKGSLVLPDAQHPHKKLGVPRPTASPTPPSTPAGANPAPAAQTPGGGDTDNTDHAKTAPQQ